MAISEPQTRLGFALPAVLAVTGVVTLIFLVAITALSSLTAEAASARARVRFIERALTAEATIAYLVATEPFGSRDILVGQPRYFDDGRGEVVSVEAPGVPVTPVRLDSSAYRLDVRGPLLVRLQDQAGMINLASLSEDQHRKLGEAVGLGGSQAATLRPLYLDYVDRDDLRQTNGAEARDYPAGTGPANRNLRRPLEWLSLLNVRSGVDPARWRALKGDLAADHTLTSWNVNTASAQTLRLLFDLTEGQAEAAIQARQTAPFNTAEDFIAASGAALLADPEVVYTFPSARLFYVISDGRSPWTYRARITLTPSGLEQPLWIDQSELTEAPRRAVADTSDAVEFPYAPR
jgi:type II secretory pathway pseudopilin PulG